VRGGQPSRRGPPKTVPSGRTLQRWLRVGCKRPARRWRRCRPPLKCPRRLGVLWSGACPEQGRQRATRPVRTWTALGRTRVLSCRRQAKPSPRDVNCGEGFCVSGGRTSGGTAGRWIAARSGFSFSRCRLRRPSLPHRPSHPLRVRSTPIGHGSAPLAPKCPIHPPASIRRWEAPPPGP